MSTPAKPAKPIKAELSALRSHKLFSLVVILACMAGAALLSLLFFKQQSLRLDEAQSIWQTSHSLGGTLRVVAQDVHVPLYHVILHFWQMYVGQDIETVRLLSLLFFLLTIPLVYVLARQILARGWALFATFIFSFSPFMSWFGTEARMYTLLVFLATLSQIFFLRIIKQKKGWLGYGGSALIGVYSHYFFSFNLASQAIFFFLNRSKFAPGALKNFIKVAALVFLALLPWLWYFRYLGSGKNTSPLLTPPSTVDFFNAYSQFAFGFQDNYINTLLVSSWPLLLLPAFFAVKRSQRVSTEVLYMATAAFVPATIAFVLSFVANPFFLSRYMISCVAPLIILAVWMISSYGPKLSRVAAIVMVIFTGCMSVIQITSADTPVKENYQGVAQTISDEAKPQDIVVLSAPFTIYPFEYYYDGPARIETLPIWTRQAAGAIPAFDKAKLPEEVSRLNQNHRYVYLVLSQDQGYQEDIRQYYLQNFKEIYRRTYSPGLYLYVFQVGYNTVPALGAPETVINAE